MARPKREPVQWPSWRHSPDGEAKLFYREEDVPVGWTRKAGEVFIPPEAPEVLDREVLMSRLTGLGIQVNPSWGTAHLKKVLDDRSPTR